MKNIKQWVLFNCNRKFGFPVSESTELLGVTLDNELRFNCHITTICDKVNDQFSVIKRFGNLFSKKILLKLQGVSKKVYSWKKSANAKSA